MEKLPGRVVPSTQTADTSKINSLPGYIFLSFQIALDRKIENTMRLMNPAAFWS
jgi:hypothetical protein